MYIVDKNPNGIVTVPKLQDFFWKMNDVEICFNYVLLPFMFRLHGPHLQMAFNQNKRVALLFLF